MQGEGCTKQLLLTQDRAKKSGAISFCYSHLFNIGSFSGKQGVTTAKIRRFSRTYVCVCAIVCVCVCVCVCVPWYIVTLCPRVFVQQFLEAVPVKAGHGAQDPERQSNDRAFDTGRLLVGKTH